MKNDSIKTIGAIRSRLGYVAPRLTGLQRLTNL